MKKRYKISLLILLLVIALAVLINYQAKRIVIGLIQSNSDNRVEVNIGRVNIKPANSSINFKDVLVFVKDNNSGSYRKLSIKRVFLDVASLWEFFTGGTLIIEKFECEGADLTLYSQATSDSTKHSFNLQSIIHRIKSDAIRFRIQDIVFRDLSLIFSKDSARAPTTIKHINARAQDLYLSADSILSKKPTIEFSLPRQIVTLPNQLSLGFDSLYFSTSNNSIQINKLELNSPAEEVDNSYHVHSDKVRLAHFSFESLYTKGTLVIDSIFLGKSTITVDWLMAQSKKAKSGQQHRSALPNMDIRSIAFKEISSDIIVRNDTVKNTFNIAHASLTIDNFRHRPDSSRIIYSPYYNLLITQYSTFLGSNHSSISFDTVQIQKHALSLLNFVYKNRNQRQPLIQTQRFELKEVDWYELLVNRRLVAHEASVFNPTIVTSIKPKENKKVEPVDSFELIASLNEILHVNLFTLKNATAFVKLADENVDITLHGYNTTLWVKALINSGNINDGLDAIGELSFRSLHVANPDFNVHVDNFKFGERAPFIGNLYYQAKANLALSLAGLNLEKISWSELNNSLTLNGLGWRSLDVKINGGQEHSSQKASNMKTSIKINDIRGGNSSLEYHKDSLTLNTSLEKVNLEELIFDDSLYVKGISIKCKSLTLDSEPNEIRIKDFTFNDEGGAISNIRFNHQGRDPYNVLVERLSFYAKLPDFARKKYAIDKLDVDRIKLQFDKQDSLHRLNLDLESGLNVSDLTYRNKTISVGAMTLNIGPVNMLNERWEKKVNVAHNTTHVGARRLTGMVDTLMQSKYDAKDIKQSEKDLRITNSNTADSAFYKKTIQVKSCMEGIKLMISDIEAFKQDSATNVKAIVNSIVFNETSVTTDKLEAQVIHGSVNNILVNSNHLKDPWKLIEDNHPTFAINNMKAKIETNGNLIQFDRLDYNPTLTSGHVRQFEFRPLKDRQQFLNDSFYQTNYMHAKIDSLSFNKINIKRFLSDTAFHLSSIQVESPSLELGRDKTHPFFATAIKPLPTNAFQKIGVKFKIDTLKVSDGKIAYTERSRITGQDGVINFSKMDALVRNVKNIDLHLDDSLRIKASTLFMDSARVNLRVRESYRDTLGGFLLSTQVGPFNTSILNKALIPLVSVDFKSGYVDTLYMRAVGREYLSLGSMKFLYHDLKVEFLDKNDTSRHSMKNQLLKFAANAFVIRTNNSERTGKVFYERDRNRAVFQYWVKMILSGVTTSVGAKSNKKQIKKYLKELNQKNLPPIEGKFDL